LMATTPASSLSPSKPPRCRATSATTTPSPTTSGRCQPPHRTRRMCDLHLHLRRFLFSRVSVSLSIWFEIAQRRLVVPQSPIQLHYVSSYSNPSPPDQDSRGCVGTSSPSPLRSYIIVHRAIAHLSIVLA
jgi:hypothetical protein